MNESDASQGPSASEFDYGLAPIFEMRWINADTRRHRARGRRH
jgi:hypothetical protein